MAATFSDFKQYCRTVAARYPALVWLTAINVLIYLTVQIDRLIGILAHLDHDVINEALLTLALSNDLHTVMNHPWSPLTYMFTQYGFMHLLFNMVWLFCFAIYIYTPHRPWRLVWVYLAGGLAGAALFIAIGMGGNGAPQKLTGSSAAVMAVMAAAAMLQPNRRVRLLLIGEVRLVWVAVICMLLTISSGGDDTGLGQAAHLAGGVAGVIAALLIRRNPRHNATPDDEPIFTSSYTSTAQYAQWSPQDPEQGWRPRHRKVKLPPQDAGTRFTEAVANRIPDSERLDQLLDKIRLSGYESLSEAEKRELNAISNRLK